MFSPNYVALALLYAFLSPAFAVTPAKGKPISNVVAPIPLFVSQNSSEFT
jgi:hypothetical protein